MTDVSEAQIISFPTPEEDQTCFACIYYAHNDAQGGGFCIWFDYEVDEVEDGRDCGEYET